MDGPPVYSYEDALALMPEVKALTGRAVERIQELLGGDSYDEWEVSEAMLPDYLGIVEEWSRSVLDLGAEVKGLWLVDFDCGSGYYCWKYPEPTLQHFHSYEEGFGGRVRLT